MKYRHIIQVSSYYPPHLGGQENAVHDLAQQLSSAGHRVEVFSSHLGGGRRGAIKEGTTLVRRLWGAAFGHAPIMPAFPWALLRAVRPDSTVHVHIGQAFTPEMVWLVSKLRRFRYIAQLHIDFEPSGPAGFLLPLYKRLVLGPVLRSASAVVTLNPQTLRAVRERYKYKGHALIINNGIGEEYFSLSRPPLPPKPPKELKLLFVGRLSKQKNIVVLLQALSKCHRPVSLELVGDGEDRQEVINLVEEYGLVDVHLRGRLSREEVRELYQNCHALVMPSLYEAQPLVLLEAMAAGIPIIATNVLGVAEHIQDGGIVVEPTTEGILEGIEQFYERYQDLAGMAARARELAEEWRWEHTLRKYEGLYETVQTN